MPAKKTASKGTGLFIAIGCCLILGTAIYFGIHSGVSRDVSVQDVQNIKEVTNLGALPSGYSIATGETMSNARTVWINHDGAAENAHVMVSIVEASDPSAHDLSRYAAIHPGQRCRAPKDTVLQSRGRVIHVVRSVCRVDDDILVQEQAVFHMSDYYSVIVNENAGSEQFDYAGFAAVLNTVLKSVPKGNSHLG